MFLMLPRLNEVDRPFCRIDVGKCATQVVSVSDQLRQPGREEEYCQSVGPIKDFMLLQTASDAQFQKVLKARPGQAVLYVAGWSDSR